MARCLSVGSLGDKPFHTMLRLCDQQTAQTLNSLNLRLLLDPVVCLDRLLYHLQVFDASSTSLRRIFACDYLREELCRCANCRNGQLEAEPLNVVFCILGRAANLQTLSMFLSEWPDMPILNAMAENCPARPTRLQLCIANELDADERGRILCRDIASHVRYLILWSYSAHPEPENNRQDGGGSDDGTDDEFDGFQNDPTVAPALYRTVLQSAAQTLRHLEFRCKEANFPTQSFIESSFDLLETLFVNLPEFVDQQGLSMTGEARCEMPSLTTMVVPASILGLIHAPLVTRAGLAVERGQTLAVRDGLAGWSNLKILSLHINVGGVDVNEILTYLTPQISLPHPFSVPELEALAIYALQPSWWTERIELEDMPRRFDWRETSKLRTWDHFEKFQKTGKGDLPRIENIIARMLVTREKFSDQPEPARYPKMKALREVRIIGYEIDERTWKALIKPSKIPRFAIWPHPPSTKAVMLWNKVTAEGKEGVMDDLDEPSESIYYVPSW